MAANVRPAHQLIAGWFFCFLISGGDEQPEPHVETLHGASAVTLWGRHRETDKGALKTLPHTHKHTHTHTHSHSHSHSLTHTRMHGYTHAYINT